MPSASPPSVNMHRPHLTYIDQPSPSAEETINWAVDRFVAAGLQLPDLEISFPVVCHGKAALYHVGRRSVDFCRVGTLLALHEFAHAWDDTSGAVDREAFLELRGLHVWFGGLDLPKEQQGAEHLAQIVSWGLMDQDLRRPPNLANNSEAELTEAFELLAGHPPLSVTAEPVR